MLGFICALSIEVEGIVNLMENKEETTVAKITYHKGNIFGKDVVCCECGIGKVNAAMSTQIMIDLYRPDVIINSGVAGSLSGDIRIGDIVISDDCVQQRVPDDQGYLRLSRTDRFGRHLHRLSRSPSARRGRLQRARVRDGGRGGRHRLLPQRRTVRDPAQYLRRFQ